MRRGNDGELVYDDSGELVGVNLGADFVSEHEWGIEDIKNAFGIGLDKKAIGGDRYLVTCLPTKPKTTYSPSFREFKADGAKGFCFCVDKPREVTFYPHNDDNGIVGAWSDRTFAVCAKHEKAIDALREIYTALLKKDAFFMLPGTNNPFGNSGLHILIASKISTDIKANWRDVHLADIAIREEWAKEAGDLEQELKNAGCSWFSLFSRIIRTKEGQLKTWLNPMDQQNNDFGWFTVADLKQWAKGEGPIPKKD